MTKKDIYDCLIIGGGPAGLMAGIYLSRFLCRIAILDNNLSRATLITKSHNFPGFPTGISGKDILALLRHQYIQLGSELIVETTLNIRKEKNNIFTLTNTHSCLQTKFVILATGVLDLEPKLPNLTEAIKNGLIRHCLVCDGYEARDQNIAVIGAKGQGINEAHLLKTYSKNVTLFFLDEKFRISKMKKDKMIEDKIVMISEPIKKVIIINNTITTLKTANDEYFFDTIYSALGCEVRSELAIKLGAKHLKNKKIITNRHQETSIKGLYAIGDVVSGLNQMCVGMGQGAIAATAIFNALKKM